MNTKEYLDAFYKNKMCGRKVKYPTERAVKKLIKKSQHSLGWYECPHCNNFHLFNKKKKPR